MLLDAADFALQQQPEDNFPMFNGRYFSGMV